jgi:GMP synthase (glutamine-hydrolysing)
MSDAFILQQAAAFGPGRLTGLLRDFGIPVQLRRLYSGDEVPSDLEEIRLIVFLGGPMRLAEADQYPFLAREIELLQRLIAHDRPVLAIGLGAQLLAHAAGAKVYANPAAEFGWLPIQLPFPGGTEPIVMGLSDGSPMFHWHHDTFDVPKNPGSPPAPPGSALLCSTKTCKNQAFRFRNRLFGFQFHLELTAPDIEAITGGAAEYRQETEKHLHRYSRLGERVIRNFVQYTKTY